MYLPVIAVPSVHYEGGGGRLCAQSVLRKTSWRCGFEFAPKYPYLYLPVIAVPSVHYAGGGGGCARKACCAKLVGGVDLNG